MDDILKKAQQRNLAVLKRIEAELREELIAAMIREKGENTPSEVLAVLYTDVGSDLDELMGEYTLFIPDVEGLEEEPAENRLMYFQSVLTFTEELPGDNLAVLYEALTKLNFTLPLGALAIDRDEERLCLRYGVPMPVTLSEDELYSYVSMYMTTGFTVADRYMAMLMGVAEGRVTVDELLEV